MKGRPLILNLVLVLLCIPIPLSAQEWARAKVDKSPRHREWVTVKHDGRSVQTYVVYPEVSDKRPVVLIIHEIFGMTDWVRDLADQVAAAGYIAVAPDLLSGMAPNGGGSSALDRSQAIKAVSMLNLDQITRDLNAVADYALKIPSSNGKLYVAGFCWGGSQSFRFATNRSDLSAAFVFYGGPPPAAEMARINAPVYGFYGGNDERVGATIPTARKEMKSAGKTYEPITYQSAGHGFMRAGEEPNASKANKQAREKAWVRWKSILARGR